MQQHSGLMVGIDDLSTPCLDQESRVPNPFKERVVYVFGFTQRPSGALLFIMFLCFSQRAVSLA
jgi:hypothetical protein